MKQLPRKNEPRWKQQFNRRQLEGMAKSNRIQPEILLYDGAVRSGKTIGQITNFLIHLYRNQGQGHKYIMTGHSLGSLQRNVLDPIREWYGIDTSLNGRREFSLFGNTVACFGTNNRDSHEAMQGMTAAGHYGNEMTLSHTNSVKEVLARCSLPGARFFWECNPAGPSHPIYQRYIERHRAQGDTKQLVRLSFSLYDNAKENGGFLPAEYIQRLEADYVGLWHKKYIMGEWTAIEGQLYFPEELQYYDESEITPEYLTRDGIINAYLDPATGSTKAAGCYTAIIVGVSKGDRLYILDVILRKYNPTETIDAARAIIKSYNLSKFAVEDNFSQAEYVLNPLRRAIPYAPIVGQSSRENKMSRLIGMYPVVTQKVYFPQRFLHERQSDGWLLLQQLANITKDRTDKAETDAQFLDGPDALEGLIRTFKGTGGGNAPAVQVGGKKTITEW